MANEKYQSNLQFTQILLNFIWGGGGGGVRGVRGVCGVRGVYNPEKTPWDSF